jgi:hypothetical protein
MLDIHELRRELVLGSGGVVPPFFMSLPRLSIVGRFWGIFWGVDVALVAAGAGGDAGLWTFGAFGGSDALGSSWCGRVGRPPWDDVFGGASLVRPGDEGACWRWWWSTTTRQMLAEHSRVYCVRRRWCYSCRMGREWSAQRKRISPLVELCSHETSTPWMSSIADVCSCDG